MNLILLLMLGTVILDMTYIKAEEICKKFNTCGDCIGNPNCIWCSAKKHDGPRCESITVINETWCEKGITYNPQMNKETVKDNPIKNARKGENDTVQFRPQIITIKARPGVPVHFNMSYGPAKDYPLDVYYLMDNSFTMVAHKKTLQAQATKIYDELISITNNVRFGVGSFVEKFALPFASPLLHDAYVFKNHLSLTEDIEKFSKIVGAINDTGNYDTPEAGLDALMQAMVCPKINWRDDARRIIVLSTDSTYHSAGDGKIVGAVKPNDMKCHMKDDKYGLEALEYDYPSVNQISKIAYENQFSIKFTALKQVKDVYEALADSIIGAKYVELSFESDIANLIKTEYLELVQNLVIETKSVPPYINITMDPSCTKDNECGFKVGETTNIEATLNITKCPDDKKYKHQIYIYPRGLVLEKLTIDIEIDCQCDCEKEGKGEMNSPICNNDGIYQCGVCKCNEQRYGDNCECRGTSTYEMDAEKCKANINDTKVCSGRADCKCGKCGECKVNYHGQFCEFSIYDCPSYMNEPCGGHGTCVNTSCVCEPTWTGPDCSCTLDQQACIGPNSKICSGNGACSCGKCECGLDAKNNTYTGTFCNHCDDCAEQRCKELEGYVECYYNNNIGNTTNDCDEQFSHTSTYNITILNRTEINAREWRSAYRCKKVLADGSFIVFKYVDKNEFTMILIQEEKEVVPEPNIWIAVWSAIGAILLIGILTVIAWKILVNIHDAKEYERFAKEAAAQGYDVTTSNPLYQPPSINIKNPAYQENY